MKFDSCSCKQQMFVCFLGWCIPAIYIFPTLEMFTLGSPHEMWLKCSLCHVHLCFCSIVAASYFCVARVHTAPLEPFPCIAPKSKIGDVCVCVNPATCHAGKNFQIRVVNKQGVDAWSGSHPPTKTLPFHGDMTKGRLCHVPAISIPVFAAFQFVEPGDRLSQEPEHVTTFEYFELILKLSDGHQLRNP